MKKEFKPIAMKCNQEQFDAVKGKLIGMQIRFMEDFSDCEYLVNNLENVNGDISNVFNNRASLFDRTVYETWNEKVFLEACGIVVEEPKEETFVITKEQILEISSRSTARRLTMEEALPSAFIEDKKDLGLEAGKWYVYPAEPEFITFVKENGRRYGIGSTGQWFTDADVVKDTRGYREATPEEVQSALEKEAVKRGFVKGAWIKWDGYEGQIIGDIYWAEGSECISATCDPGTTKRNNKNFPLMLNGVWAEFFTCC